MSLKDINPGSLQTIADWTPDKLRGVVFIMHYAYPRVGRPEPTYVLHEILKPTCARRRAQPTGDEEPDDTPVSQRDNRPLLAYAKLIHNTPEENLTEWDFVQEAEQLPNSEFIREMREKRRGLYHKIPDRELANITNQLKAEIRGKLVALAKLKIQTARDQRRAYQAHTC